MNKLYNIGIVLIFILVISCKKDESIELITPYFIGNNCETIDPFLINGFSLDCYQTILEEDFLDNQNGWNIGNTDSYSQKIEESNLQLETEENEQYIWGLSKEFPGLASFQNYEFKVILKVLDVNEFNTMDISTLLLGSNTDLSSHLAFRFNNRGDFGLYKVIDSSVSELYRGKLPNNNTFASYQSITFRTYSNFTLLFINEDLVYNSERIELFGDIVYFGAGPGYQIWIDYVILSSLYF